MSKSKTLVEHAAYELTKAGIANHEDSDARKVARDIMALVRRFEKQDHSEKNAPVVLQAFETLCNFLPLTPITDDPEEWEKFEIDRKNVDTNEIEKRVVWQSRRAPSLFSEDKGKTFTDQRTGKVGESIDHIKQAEEAAQAKEDRDKRKAEAEARRKAPVQPIEHSSPDVPAGETSILPQKSDTPSTPDKKKAKPKSTGKGQSKKKETK